MVVIGGDSGCLQLFSACFVFGPQMMTFKQQDDGKVLAKSIPESVASVLFTLKLFTFSNLPSLFSWVSVTYVSERFPGNRT